MPTEGIALTAKPKLLTTDELRRLARIFVRNGVRKVRLTGGEPTIRRDLVEVVRHLHKLNLDSIGLTSNGLTLKRHLPALLDAGVTQVNISLDTLHPEKFTFLTRMKGFERVWDCISAAENLFNCDKMLKLNVVVMRGLNDDEICDFVALTHDRRLDVRFIEYMPFGGNKWERKKLVSYFEILDIVKSRFPDFEKIVDERTSTTKAYKLPGSRGQFGFITSMTANFCGSCNRVRLTADGNLKVCLHGAAEVSLRDAMRQGATDGDLEQMIRLALARKKPMHDGMDVLAQLKNRPMTSIGNAASKRFVGLARSHLSPRYLKSKSRLTSNSVPLIHLQPRKSKETESKKAFPNMLNLNAQRATVTAVRCLTTSQPVRASGQIEDGSGYLADISTRLKQLLQLGPGQGSTQSKLFPDRRSRKDFLGIDLDNLFSVSAEQRERVSHNPKESKRVGTDVASPTRKGHDPAKEPTASPKYPIEPERAPPEWYDLMEPWEDHSTQSQPPSPKPTSSSPQKNPKNGSLTHVNPESGTIHMVDVSEKIATFRTAEAKATVKLDPAITEVLTSLHGTHKGNVLTTAEIAGIMAAKQTSNLIPLCHNLPLSKVHVSARLNAEFHSVQLTAIAKCHGTTGVEMEALTAVSVAALTIYDMCKGVSHNMQIGEVGLVRKTGGKSGLVNTLESIAFD